MTSSLRVHAFRRTRVDTYYKCSGYEKEGGDRGNRERGDREVIEGAQRGEEIDWRR